MSWSWYMLQSLQILITVLINGYHNFLFNVPVSLAGYLAQRPGNDYVFSPLNSATCHQLFSVIDAHKHLGNQSLKTDSSWITKYFNQYYRRSRECRWGRVLSLLNITQCPGFKPGGSAWAVEAIRACEEAMSLRNVNLVWPLASSEGKTLAFHPSRVCICLTSYFF